eukprot:g8908.t3
MARCYTVLRVSLQDIIEGKASTCVLTGENGAEVAESCLLWLKETTTRTVTVDWATRGRGRFSGAGENAQLQPWSESTESRNNGGEGGASILTLSEAAVANECLVSLLAVHGTTSRLATFAQLTAALKREGFPDAGASLVLLKDVREE